MPDKKTEIDNVEENSLKFGHLFIDMMSKKVKIEDSIVPLTKTEFEILFMLASHPLRIYSRLQIINATRENLAVTEHTVDVHIANLRKKLGGKSCCIFNHSGFGYEFDPRILLDSEKKT